MATNLCFGLMCSMLIFSNAFAETTCPVVSVLSHCINNVWQIEINLNESNWELTSSDPSGQPCSSVAAAPTVEWDYAFVFRRLAMTGCHYNLLDPNGEKLHDIQIKTSACEPIGEDWEEGGYPGYKKCRVARERCLFR